MTTLFAADDRRLLRNALAKTIPLHEIQLICSDAHLPLERISLDGAAIVVWHSILDEAERIGPAAVRKLLRICLERAPVLAAGDVGYILWRMGAQWNSTVGNLIDAHKVQISRSQYKVLASPAAQVLLTGVVVWALTWSVSPSKVFVLIAVAGMFGWISWLTFQNIRLFPRRQRAPLLIALSLIFATLCLCLFAVATYNAWLHYLNQVEGAPLYSAAESQKRVQEEHSLAGVSEAERESVAPSNASNPASGNIDLTIRAPAPPVGLSKDNHIKWVLIPGGTLELDSLSDTHSGRKQLLTVRPFYISQSEVTVAQYRDCIESGACSKEPISVAEHLIECTWRRDARGQYPMNCVSKHDAELFAAWVGGRLPNEVEWEFAARGNGASDYPWGNIMPTCRLAVMRDCADGAGPVCSKPQGRTPGGVCDMVGNVAEWVDWHPAPGAADYSDSDKMYLDLLWVTRGGSWFSAASQLDPRQRSRRHPKSENFNRARDIGIRVVADVHSQ